MKFVYGEGESLYGKLRQVTYRPIMEDREQNADEVAEESRLRREILNLHGEHGEIDKQFAIGKVLPEEWEAKKTRLREIEKELGI